jgi:hypothetical protein
MPTVLKQLPLVLFAILLFPFFGYDQVHGKEFDISEQNEELLYLNSGNTSNTKSIIEPCKSWLEQDEVIALMDTITAVVHVDFYCSCSDLLTGAHVKLSSKDRICEQITDESGCNFRHIGSGKYRMEIVHEAVQKFESVEVVVMSGAIARWKVFLCGTN